MRGSANAGAGTRRGGADLGDTAVNLFDVRRALHSGACHGGIHPDLLDAQGDELDVDLARDPGTGFGRPRGDGLDALGDPIDVNRVRNTGRRERTDGHAQDDKQDQAFIIHEYFLAQGTLPHPDKATKYSYGNDSDTNAICDTLEPRRDANSPYEWIVVAHYGDAQSTEKGEDDNENPTDNPLEFATVVTHRTNKRMVPIEDAEYVGVRYQRLAFVILCGRLGLLEPQRVQHARWVGRVILILDEKMYK